MSLKAPYKHGASQIHHKSKNRKSGKFYTFLFKNYPHQLPYSTVYIHFCYSKSTCTNPSIVENVHHFIHFCSKSIYISSSIYTQLLQFSIFFSLLYPLSSDSLFFYSHSPLSSLESNNKFIQIIKFFKLVLNLDPKFIKPSHQRKKKGKEKKKERECLEK